MCRDGGRDGGEIRETKESKQSTRSCQFESIASHIHNLPLLPPFILSRKRETEHVYSQLVLLTFVVHLHILDSYWEQTRRGRRCKQAPQACSLFSERRASQERAYRHKPELLFRGQRLVSQVCALMVNPRIASDKRPLISLSRVFPNYIP